MLPYWSICAPPMKPTSTKPRWAKRNASVMPGSIVARWPARISLVETGNRPGAIWGPMMPPSITIVRRGAWRRLASAAARSGTPTPANTVVSSWSWRAAMTARSSEALNRSVIASSARARRLPRVARHRCLTWSSRELLRSFGLKGQALAAEEIEVIAPRRRSVDVALEIFADGRRAARVDGRRVLREVIVIGLVERVALVREGAEWHVHERVDDETRDHGAIRIAACLLLGNDLLGRHQDRRCRARDVGVHVRVAVDLAVAEPVSAMHVQNRDVGKERRHRREDLAGVRVLHGLQAAHADQVRAEHREGRQKWHAHRPRTKAQPEGQMAPFLQRDSAGFDVVAEDLRHAPWQADRHPRGDDAAHRSGRHEHLALVAREIAREREPAAAVAKDLAHERHGRAREEAAADTHMVAVLDPGHRVLEARELLARRLSLGLGALARSDEVVLEGVQVRISHCGW